MQFTTQHRGKMKGMVSLSTNPYSNPFCERMSKTESICKHCYARKLLKIPTYNFAKNRYEKNSKELSSGLLKPEQIPFLNFAFVRFSAFGELINKTHYENLCLIAEKNPQTMFSLFTKRPDLVYEVGMVENMVYIYSSPKVDQRDPQIPEAFDKVFSVYTKEGKDRLKVEINCQAECASCLKCYRKKGSPFIKELIR